MGGNASDSSNAGHQASSNTSISGGSSTSTSNPQLTPQQLIDLYSTALPQFNKTVSGLTASNNPAQAAANKGAIEGVNAINLNGLSPGEANAVERSTNQANAATGNLGINNGTNTIANAMNFGGAFNNKLNLLNQATQTATGAANSQSNALNTTAGLFSPVTAVGTAPISKSTSTFGTQSAGSSFGANAGSSGSQGGGINCCFIFLESYHGKLPAVVRKCRDVYYRKFPNIAQGYIKSAKVLVPLMKRIPLVRWLIWVTMVKPLTEHGYSVLYREQHNSHKTIRKFWFSVWNLIGGAYAR